jgi:hypothetical protein
MASSAAGSRAGQGEPRRSTAATPAAPQIGSVPMAITVRRGFRVRAIRIARPEPLAVPAWHGQIVRLSVITPPE